MQSICNQFKLGIYLYRYVAFLNYGAWYGPLIINVNISSCSLQCICVLCTEKRFGRQKGKNTFIFHQNDLMDQCSIDRIPHLTMALVKCRVIFKGMEQEKLFLIYHLPANWMKNIKSRKFQIKVKLLSK